MKLEILKTINCLTHFRGKEKEEHMGYTKKEQEEINTWLVHVGALSDVDEPFEEFKKGQLLEIARAEKGSKVDCRCPERGGRNYSQCP